MNILVPKSWVPLECPSTAPACVTDEDESPEYTDTILLPGDDQHLPEEQTTSTSSHFYVMTLVPMLVIILLSIVLTVVLLIRKGKKKYLYPTGRSFSNPNYYSSGSDGNAPAHNNVDKKQFIWKRLKYDKSQVSGNHIILITHFRKLLNFIHFICSLHLNLHFILVFAGV